MDDWQQRALIAERHLDTAMNALDQIALGGEDYRQTIPLTELARELHKRRVLAEKARATIRGYGP